MKGSKIVDFKQNEKMYHINNKNDPDTFRNGSLEMNWKPSIFVGFRFDVLYEHNNYYPDNHNPSNLEWKHLLEKNHL